MASFKERVLIVDDEPAVRSFLTAALEDMGYHAVEASDGFSALEAVSAQDCIDLLITDLGLPHGMSGRQLAHACRAKHPDLRVLFITGHSGDEAQELENLEAGMSSMTKPFPIAAFEYHVRMLTGR